MKKVDFIKYAESLLVNIPDKDESIKYILSIATKRPIKELQLVEELTLGEFRKFDKFVKLRSRHVPLDKIIGYKEFYDLKIPFNRNVLTLDTKQKFLPIWLLKIFERISKKIPRQFLICVREVAV